MIQALVAEPTCGHWFACQCVYDLPRLRVSDFLLVPCGVCGPVCDASWHGRLPSFALQPVGRTPASHDPCLYICLPSFRPTTCGKNSCVPRSLPFHLRATPTAFVYANLAPSEIRTTADDMVGRTAQQFGRLQKRWHVRCVSYLTSLLHNAKLLIT
jgi:hypothetical protein